MRQLAVVCLGIEGPFVLDDGEVDHVTEVVESPVADLDRVTGGELFELDGIVVEHREHRLSIEEQRSGASSEVRG
ncbi:MAG: hypothetical protein R2697_14700 [Ilumatobacteraceae bacterium]